MNNTAEDKPNSTKHRSYRRRHQLLVPALVIALAAIGYWLWERSTHVYTDDARISTDLVVISSKVSGRVESLAVKEGSTLQKGDLVAQLDARETALKVEELKAQLQATEASIAQGEAEIAMVGRQTGGALQAAESRLTAARANLASTESDLELQTAEWERAQSLRERGIVSQQGWEQARSAFQVAQQGQNSARAQVASAEAGLVEATAARERLVVLEQNQLRLRFDRDRTQHQLSGHQVALEERRITAPIDGIVDKTFVNAGEYVLPGQRLALVHNPDQVWVNANVKETQVRHLQLGQRVKISVDAWPDEVFEGELVRIGNAATSEFSLLPSTNPSGNFTKVTQRLPIKVAVEQRQRMLKPGMMVEIAIDIR